MMYTAKEHNTGSEVLTGPGDEALKQIFLDIAEDKEFVIKEMEIMPDHVHVFA